MGETFRHVFLDDNARRYTAAGITQRDIEDHILAFQDLLGTVVLEEVAFRGVLFGAWARLGSPARAAVGSSLIFGLWHIRPAIELLDVNAIGESALTRIPLVMAAVVLTAAAGVFFCVLRLRSRSLLAPALAHAAINSLATVAAFAAR